jgi:hypothetical protein
MHMSEGDKKALERVWLDRFRKVSGHQLPTDDNRDDKERPDFLVRCGDRLVGLEIAELQIDRGRKLFGGSALQSELSLQESVVSRARVLYSETGSKPINAQVYFRSSPGQSLSSVRRGDLAQALAHALTQMSLEPMQQSRLDADSVPPVPDPISFVYVRGLPADITPRWQVVSPGWSKAFEASDVASLISSKNALIHEYRRTVVENWLLVVADGRKPPGMFRTHGEDHIDLPVSEFDRTFFLCEPERLFIEWPARLRDAV